MVCFERNRLSYLKCGGLSNGRGLCRIYLFTECACAGKCSVRAYSVLPFRQLSGLMKKTSYRTLCGQRIRVLRDVEKWDPQKDPIHVHFVRIVQASPVSSEKGRGWEVSRLGLKAAKWYLRHPEFLPAMQSGERIIFPATVMANTQSSPHRKHDTIPVLHKFNGGYELSSTCSVCVEVASFIVPVFLA